MIPINGLSWLWCLASTACAGFTIYSRRGDFQRDSAENNVQFRSLQRKFLFPYLAVLFAESLQVPFLYALFRGYGYTPSQIAVLYVIGLVANVIFGFYSVHVLARHGRRTFCLLALALGSIGCSLKFFDSFLLLVIGRLFDGFFTALIVPPFQQWYTHEHLIGFDFPPEWISSTFTLVSLGAGFLSIMSGLTAEAVVSISHLNVLPYALSIFAMIAAGFFIGTAWPENKAIDAPLPFKSVMTKAIGVLKGSPLALVLCIVSVCMESATQIFVFIWAPIFLRAKHREHVNIELGAIYASLVSSYLLGLLIYSSTLAKRISNTKLLAAASITAFFSLMFSLSSIPSLTVGWQSARFDHIFIGFVVFEIAAGLYNPSMESLQCALLPVLQRSALTALIRLPLTLIVTSSIVFLFPAAAGGEHKIVVPAVILVFVASALSILLDIVISRRLPARQAQQHPDHFFLPRTVADTASTSSAEAQSAGI